MLNVNTATSLPAAIVGLFVAASLAAIVIGLELIVLTAIMNLFGVSIPVN